jgi:hypothetical protein
MTDQDFGSWHEEMADLIDAIEIRGVKDWLEGRAEHVHDWAEGIDTSIRRDD